MRIRELGGVNAFHEDRHEVMAESWLESIKDYLSVNSAMADWTFAWMLDENMELVKFLNALKVKQSVLMKQAIIGKVIRCIGSLAITIVDNGSDFLLAADYFRRGDASWGKLTISFPLTSNILQCLFSIADKDSISVTFLALFGLKPFIDTWRTVTSAPQGTRRFNPVLSMAANRGIELIFESTPQTFFQTFRVIRSTAEHEIISSVQYATLIISFLAIGFIFTIMDYEIDTSEHHRKTESKIFGYIPSSKGKRVIFTLMLMIHVSSYSAMRTIAGSALVYANPTLFAIWAAVLFAAFTGIKVFRRTYNTFKPAPGFFPM